MALRLDRGGMVTIFTLLSLAETAVKLFSHIPQKAIIKLITRIRARPAILIRRSSCFHSGIANDGLIVKFLPPVNSFAA